MSLSSAFGILLSLHSRMMTLTRPGGASVNVKVCPSNYFRNLAGPEEITIEGREFVISKSELAASGWVGNIKKGDRLTDSELGSNSVQEVREMFDLGAVVMGYRIRIN